MLIFIYQISDKQIKSTIFKGVAPYNYTTKDSCCQVFFSGFFIFLLFFGYFTALYQNSIYETPDSVDINFIYNYPSYLIQKRRSVNAERLFLYLILKINHRNEHNRIFLYYFPRKAAPIIPASFPSVATHTFVCFALCFV